MTATPPDDPTATHASPARRWVDRVLLVAALALLAALATRMDWSATMRTVTGADPGLLLAAVVVDFSSLVLKGVRWGGLLAGVGVAGMGRAIRASIAGAALNNVLVANGGDAARVAMVVRQSRARSADVLGALAVDRLCDAATFVLLFGSVALTAALPSELARWKVAAVASLVVVAIVCVALVRRRPRVPAAIGSPSARGLAGGAAANRWLGRTRDYAVRLFHTSASVAGGPRFGAALVLSGLAWAGQWAVFHIAARATGSTITPLGSLLALLAVNAGFLVRITPGNIGVFQLLYALAAATVGVPRESAVAAAVLVQLVQFIPVTVVGLLLAPASSRHGAGDGTPRLEASRSDT